MRKEDIFGIATEQNPRYKPVNQDCAFAGYVTTQQAGIIRVAMVADGVSSSYHGEEASRKAVEGFYQQLQKITFSSAHELVTICPGILDRINADIIESADGSTGTTFTAAIILEDGVVISHIGDSRVYRITPKTCSLLTEDHTELARAKKEGCSEEELDAINPHVIEQCLGMDRVIRPMVTLNPGGVEKEEGAVLLLTTDGVHDVLSSSSLISVYATSKNIGQYCKDLVKKALVSTGATGKPNKDNITAAAISLTPGKDTPAENGRPAIMAHKGGASKKKWYALAACFTLLFLILGIMFVFTGGEEKGPEAVLQDPNVIEAALEQQEKAAKKARKKVPPQKTEQAEPPAPRFEVEGGDKSHSDGKKTVENGSRRSNGETKQISEAPSPGKADPRPPSSPALFAIKTVQRSVVKKDKSLVITITLAAGFDADKMIKIGETPTRRYIDFRAIDLIDPDIKSQFEKLKAELESDIKEMEFRSSYHEQTSEGVPANTYRISVNRRWTLETDTPPPVRVRFTLSI